MKRKARTLCVLALAVPLGPPSTALLAQPATMVKDIRSGSSTPFLPSPALWTAQLGGFTYFEFDDGMHGPEIWRSDGTAAGTALFVDICPGICVGVREGEIVLSGGKLFFDADDGVHGTELWVSDGTQSGTHLVF